MRLSAAAFLAAAGFVLAASLYYPPSFGLVGGFLNQLFFSSLGWTSYAVPAFILWAAYRSWQFRKEPRGPLTFFTAAYLVPFVGFALGSILWSLLVFSQPEIAGSWGWNMANGLVLRIGFFGTVTAALAAAMLWTYVVFGVPWVELGKKATDIVKKDVEDWWASWKQSQKIKNSLKGSQMQAPAQPKAAASKPEPVTAEPAAIPKIKIEPPKEEPALKNGGSHSSKPANPKPFSMVEGRWKLPPLDLLAPAEPHQKISEDIFEERAQSLLRAMASFGVQVTLDGIVRGPVVTRYDVVPAPGVKVGTIEALVNDIALAMKVESVRPVGLIAGKGAIGIEVPNPKRQMVRMREVLESPKFAQGDGQLLFGMGRLANGEALTCDLAGMPHFLVAGATNSGKSVLVHAIISSFLFRMTPDELKLVLIDPKRLELPFYDGIPHIFDPKRIPADAHVITDSKEASKTLNVMVDLMEIRYEKFGEKSVRNILSYNELAKKEGFAPEPYIVVVIDELADMMLVAGKEVEHNIQRLAQMARAVGIHLVLATQRPSVNVITGVIKANLPARAALQVVSSIDSRVILDSIGAETLLGKGDILYLASGEPKPVRVQGAYISDEEIKKLVSFWKAQGGPEYPEPAELLGLKTIAGGIKVSKEDEENVKAALKLVIERRRVSQDLLKDFFRTSSKATNVLSQLEVGGFIFKPEGSNRWEIRYDRIEEYLKQG